MIRNFKCIFQLAKCFPLLYISFAVIFSLVYVLPVFPGILIKAFFDVITDNAELGLSIATIIALLSIVGIARMLATLYGLWLESSFRTKISATIRKNVIAYSLDKINPHQTLYSSGEAVSYLRDDVDIVENLVALSVDILGMGLFTVLSFCILFTINSTMTLLVFIPLFLILAFVQIASTRLQKYRKEHRDQASRVTQAIGDMFSNIEAIKGSCAEDNILKNFKVLNEKRRQSLLKDLLFKLTLDSFSANTVNIGTGIILFLSAGLMIKGSFTLGDFAIFVYFITFVNDFIKLFGEFITSYSQAGVSIDRLLLLINNESIDRLTKKSPLYIGDKYSPKPKNNRPLYPPLITLEYQNIVYRHPGAVNPVALKQLSVKKNAVVVLAGRVGSGKSTLLKAMIGLLPAAGIYKYNGNIVNPQAFFIPPISSYVPQVPDLYNDCVLNNILLGMTVDNGLLNRALYLSALVDDINSGRLLLNRKVGDEGCLLSGGQKKRIALARALVRKPELMVIDDISSGLDAETEKRVVERILNESNMTLIIASNRRQVLENSTRILLLKDGEVSADGRYQDLLTTNAAMQALIANASSSANNTEIKNSYYL